MRKLKTLFALLVLSFFTIGNVWATDTYELTTTITDGDYVIGAIQGSAGANNTIKAIQCTVTSGWGKYRAITPSNGTITDPNSDVVWTLKKISDNSFSLKNGTNYYKISTGTGDGSVSLDTKSSTIYFAAVGNSTNAFELSGVSDFTVSSKNQLACNQSGSYGYRQYAQRNHGTGNTDISTQIRFYKKAVDNTKVVTPTFSPDAGTYASAQSVTISTTTEGATIYYTMGATPADPTTSSTQYTSAIAVEGSTTIKAIL